MKKIIYLLTLSAFVFTGCNPNEDINADIDAQTSPIVGDVVYTLTDDDYDELDLSYGNFSNTQDAKDMVPSLLSDLFPVWGLGSSALVSYNIFNRVSTYEAEVYTLTSAEHNAITGSTYGNFSSGGDVYDYLDATYLNPEDGDFVSLKYKYYSGSVTTLTNGFAYEGGEWVKFTGFTPDQYAEMGEGYPNFSSEDEANQKIPIALLDVFRFDPRNSGDIVLAMYEIYEGGGVTKSYTAAYVFDGTVFSAYENILEETLQFGHDGENWVPDNTIKYTLVDSDIDFISDAFSAIYEGPASNVGNYGSFDRRSGGSNYWSDAMLLEAFGALLDDQSPSAEKDKSTFLSYVIYNGSTANESMSVIKTGGEWVLN